VVAKRKKIPAVIAYFKVLLHHMPGELRKSLSQNSQLKAKKGIHKLPNREQKCSALNCNIWSLLKFPILCKYKVQKNYHSWKFNICFKISNYSKI
jgi:hypothetical protein